MYLFQADQICYAVLCVFSFVAAGRRASDPNKAGIKMLRDPSPAYFPVKPKL